MKLLCFVIAASAALGVIQTAALPVDESITAPVTEPPIAPAAPVLIVPAAEDYDGIKSFLTSALQNISTSIINLNTTVHDYVDKPTNTQVPSSSAQALLSALNGTAGTLTLSRFQFVFFAADETEFVDAQFYSMYLDISRIMGLLRDNVRIMNGKAGAKEWLSKFLPDVEKSFSYFLRGLIRFVQSEKYEARMQRTKRMLDQEFVETLRAFGLEEELASFRQGSDKAAVGGTETSIAPELDPTFMSEWTKTSLDSVHNLSNLTLLEQYIEQTRTRINIELDVLASTLRAALQKNSSSLL